MQAPDPGKQFGKVFTIATWLILLVGLFVFFQDVLDKQFNPNSQLQSVSGSGGEIRTVLTRNRYGHYVGTALINDQAVDFMLDTGATTIAIDAITANRLGLLRGQQIQVSTANGIATAYRSKVDTLQLGDIILHDIPASIVPGMADDEDGREILLGMSALKQVEFHQQGNQLTLIQHR